MARVTELRTVADCTIALRQSTVLYAVGADADLEHWRARAEEMAQQLSDAMAVALMSQADLPLGLDHIGLRQWNTIAYLGDGKAILAWPLRAMEDQLPWLMDERAPRAPEADPESRAGYALG